MSEETEALILQTVKEMCEAHREGIRGVQLNIEASQTVTGMQLKNINDHLVKQNHSIEKLWKESDARKKVVEDYLQHKEKSLRREKVMEWMKKRWYLTALIGFLLFGMLYGFFEVVGLGNFIRMIWDKI